MNDVDIRTKWTFDVTEDAVYLLDFYTTGNNGYSGTFTYTTTTDKTYLYCGAKFSTTYYIEAKYGEAFNLGYGNTPNGYKSIGWFTKPNGEGEKIAGLDGKSLANCISSQDMDVYYYYTPRQYTIKFDSQGGSQCEDMQIYFDETINFPTPTREGYTFAYWTDSTTWKTVWKNNGDKMPALTGMDTIKTLYAVWKEITE